MARVRESKKLKEKKYIANEINMGELKLDEVEKKVCDNIIRSVRMVEDEVVSKLVTGEYSLLLGEVELLHSFTHYLDDNGINTGKDVGYIMMEMSDEVNQPVIVVKGNKVTGETILMRMCIIKKSDMLINIIDQGIKEKEGYNKFDVKKLLTIEIEETGEGRSIYSKFLEKGDELSEENVRKITGCIFNPTKTLKNIVENVRKEDENKGIMYG